MHKRITIELHLTVENEDETNEALEVLAKQLSILEHMPWETKLERMDVEAWGN